jgi:hypothetical protein
MIDIVLNSVMLYEGRRYTPGGRVSVPAHVAKAMFSTDSARTVDPSLSRGWEKRARCSRGGEVARPIPGAIVTPKVTEGDRTRVRLAAQRAARQESTKPPMQRRTLTPAEALARIKPLPAFGAERQCSPATAAMCVGIPDFRSHLPHRW